MRHEPGALYVDGGRDLYTPETRATGNLDATGLAHLLAIPGHVPELAGIGPTVPLLAPRDVVVYGDPLPEGDVELRLIKDLHITRIPALTVHDDVQAAATMARREIETRAPTFVVHCDVDVLAFVDAPIADVPDSGGEPVGLTLDELAFSLATFVISPRFEGLVITAVNPDHAPDPDVLRQFVEALAAVLTENA